MSQYRRFSNTLGCELNKLNEHKTAPQITSDSPTEQVRDYRPVRELPTYLGFDKGDDYSFPGS